ncbi:MAG: acyl-CoA/acyl-ACP dehydrogenase [Alphaproteobacteria bacterium]|nr:acyl-CoA/acyl-ACP dehydrogenase [Alphaproteobacteria bacterium]
MEFTADQIAVRDGVRRLCARFDADYWLARDRDGRFPTELQQALAADGWLGITLPVEYGGAGLGVTEGALMMQAIAESGACMSGFSAVAHYLFSPMPIARYGTEEQKRRMLVPLIKGDDLGSFGITEPDAGLNTTQIKTTARREGDRYVISGSKVWTSAAQRATKYMILARTTPVAECKRPADGLSLFFTKFDRSRIEVREIEKMGRKAVDSNQVFIDNLEVPVADRIGEEGRGFYYLLDGLNPERILMGAAAVGIGRVALERAARYARERVVFGRPIGQNQAIQHPLARCWMELEAADLMVFKAARLYDQGLPCGPEANAAKFLGAEAGYTACETAVMTHGGYGYAKEFHVERYLREVIIARLAPVSRELIFCHIAEKVLGLPKSY